MGFTKEQRLKGLKKQLRNLGYTVTRGGAAPEPETETGSVTEEEEPILASLHAKDEEWA